MTLQEIKDQVAADIQAKDGYVLPLITIDNYVTRVAKMYATECVKASLDRAAECALVNGGSESITVHKSSITDPKNIVLL